MTTLTETPARPVDRQVTPRADYFNTNNFDLVRLVAAAQVMLFHGIFYSGAPLQAFAAVIAYLPGVPAFFFVSGFLISASWERNSSLKTFFVNRVLRIFPGLWGVLAFSVATLLVFYDREILGDNWGKLLLWVICQATILQDWIPDFMRGYGVGGMNGSLWTIPVELSFYVSIPILYWLFRHLRSPNMILASVLIASFGLQYALYTFADQLPEIVYKLVHKSPLPWIGMFCCGILAQRHLNHFIGHIEGRFPRYLAMYIVVSLLAHFFPLYPLLQGNSNSMGILNYAALCALILSAAYTKPTLADNLLQRNDISYGIYIFHMPVINVLVAQSVNGWNGLIGTLVITTCLAGLSWTLIERPALGLRRWALYSR